MPMRNIRRIRFPELGKVIYRPGEPRSNFLITPDGLKQKFRYGNLLKSVRLKRTKEGAGHKERLVYPPDVHPKTLGEGDHGLVIRISPSDEAKLLSITGTDVAKHLHSVVLKLYHLDNAAEGKPDGITQYYANSMVYNWIKNQSRTHFDLASLRVFAVSDRVMARRFIYAPTLEEARASLIGKYNKEKPLGSALSNSQISHFLKMRRLDLGPIERAERELNKIFHQGQKYNFGSPFEIEPDYTWKNIFVSGRMPDGTILFSIIDQSKKHIDGLGELLREGKLFPHH